MRERAFTDTPFGVELASLHALIDGALLAAVADGSSPLASQYITTTSSSLFAPGTRILCLFVRRFFAEIFWVVCHVITCHVITLSYTLARLTVVDLRSRRRLLVGVDIDALLSPLLDWVRGTRACVVSRVV